MAYTDIDKPSDYFNTVLYTGTGSGASNRQITGVGFQPNFTWVKTRGSSQEHVLVDSIRGATKALDSTADGAEETNNTRIGAFISDGFQLGSGSVQNRVNHNATTITSWNWLAGTSFTNDASSTSIGTIDSTGSASDVSGFSIVSFTGTGSNGTIKHGLSTAPSMVIIKRRDSANDWRVGSDVLTNFVKHINLNTTAAESDLAAAFNSTGPTTSVFSVGTSVSVNASSGTHIAYCFAEKQGYLKTGKWTGNGNANGPFSYTGFKPAFILIKRTDVAKNWYINDNLRLGYNVNNPYISPNLTAAETGGTEIDILSNGFKIRAGGTGHNQSGGTYIYMAIAENPFVTSTGVPATAR